MLYVVDSRYAIYHILIIFYNILRSRYHICPQICYVESAQTDASLDLIHTSFAAYPITSTNAPKSQTPHTLTIEHIYACWVATPPIGLNNSAHAARHRACGSVCPIVRSTQLRGLRFDCVRVRNANTRMYIYVLYLMYSLLLVTETECRFCGNGPDFAFKILFSMFNPWRDKG